MIITAHCAWSRLLLGHRQSKSWRSVNWVERLIGVVRWMRHFNVNRRISSLTCFRRQLGIFRSTLRCSNQQYKISKVGREFYAFQLLLRFSFCRFVWRPLFMTASWSELFDPFEIGRKRGRSNLWMHCIITRIDIENYERSISSKQKCVNVDDTLEVNWIETQGKYHPMKLNKRIGDQTMTKAWIARGKAESLSPSPFSHVRDSFLIDDLITQLHQIVRKLLFD